MKLEADMKSLKRDIWLPLAKLCFRASELRPKNSQKLTSEGETFHLWPKLSSIWLEYCIYIKFFFFFLSNREYKKKQKILRA